VTCDESRIVAFLNGELSKADEQAFDEHLLICEPCWRAVREDRAARLALERLRVPAPPGLADRVAASVELAARSKSDDMGSQRLRSPGRVLMSRIGRGRRGRILVGALLGLALVGGLIAWAVTSRQANDPPQISAVVAMMAPKTASTPALRRGEHLVISGQAMRVRAYHVEGATTLVATSDRPFPMPGNSHLVAGSSSGAWMATRGSLALYCVNHKVGDVHMSMFLVADMPMARLPELAARLHLI
jgi:anti-sigma factor RsiW